LIEDVKLMETRKTVALLLGLPITFISLALLAGGIENAWIILWTSVVCTAGISLLIWVPLWWFVGWVIIKIFESLTGRTIAGGADIEETQAISSGETVAISSDQKSLINYIEKAKKQGMSETQISNRLKAQGWGEDEIQQAQYFARESLGES
jgi:hypothetical protein